jgi:hypothetical protein
MATLGSRPISALNLGDRRQRRQRRQPQWVFVVPQEGWLALALGDEPDHLGPLAGPEAFSEPQPGPQPTYGPGRGGAMGETGYFLDRYVY